MLHAVVTNYVHHCYVVCIVDSFFFIISYFHWRFLVINMNTDLDRTSQSSLRILLNFLNFYFLNFKKFIYLFIIFKFIFIF